MEGIQIPSRSAPVRESPPQEDALTVLFPALVSHFAHLTPSIQSDFLLNLLQHSPIPVLRSVHAFLTEKFPQDFKFLGPLPRELGLHVLSFLPFSAVYSASGVSKSWRGMIDYNSVLWGDLLKGNHLWFGHGCEAKIAGRRRAVKAQTIQPPHPYKALFKLRNLTHTRWANNPKPKHFFFRSRAQCVTRVIVSGGRIILAMDNARASENPILVYSISNGELLHTLKGHVGGVWVLAVYKSTLVSGSTDSEVGIWDLSGTGKKPCHSSAYRAMSHGRHWNGTGGTGMALEAREWH
jgi:F-box and WD-40 domain protein CDC4